MGKVKSFKFVLGEPGSGKSTQLIQDAYNVVNGGNDIFIMTPTNTAKKRLIKDFNEKLNKSVGRVWQNYLSLITNTHVLYGYKGEANIYIDEISMLAVDHLYSLLYQIQQLPYDVNIVAFGDVKQLPCVHGAGVVQVLFIANSDTFPGIKNNFWEWVNSNLYDGVYSSELTIPNTWASTVESITLDIKNENYRLKEISGVDGYNESFYDYVFDTSVRTMEDYTAAVIEDFEAGYLFITPTHDRGLEIDKILSEYYGDTWKQKAPFVRKQKKDPKIYLNPASESSYNFALPLNESVKSSYHFSAYTTVHAVQGAETEKVCFYMGSDPIGQLNQRFYNSNLFYTAISRGKDQWDLLGNKTDFVAMKGVRPESPSVYISRQQAKEALNRTLETVIELGNENKLDANQIYDLYLTIFSNLNLDNNIRNDLALIDTNEPKPYDQTRVLSAFSPSADNDYIGELLKLGYGFLYVGYTSSIKAKSASGKHKSKTETWFDGLDDQTRVEVKSDVGTLSRSKFRDKYNMDKRNVERLIA